VAEATGTGIGPAIQALETARRLGSLPATDGAMRQGRLSETQVREIAGAAIVEPGAEKELVKTAEQQPLTLLKLRCRRVRATGPDQTTAYEAIRRGRSLRHWTDNDGAVRFDARLTPDDGARLVASLKAEAERLATEARRVGLHEPQRALAADALIRLACGGRNPGGPGARGAGRASGRGRAKGDTGPSGPATMVHVRVDHRALTRGHLRKGEICEIPGVGPIPVDVARRLAVDSILNVLVTDGVDVTAVAHAGRTIPASLRRALTERDPECVVPGCSLRDDLEIDHIEPFALGGVTSLDNLARLCHWHHYLKTHHGHLLERDGTNWRWIVPRGQGRATPTPHLSG
jgi:hypothetical protein